MVAGTAKEVAALATRPRAYAPGLLRYSQSISEVGNLIGLSLQSTFSPWPSISTASLVSAVRAARIFRREVLELLIGQRPQESNQRRPLIVIKVERPDERRLERIRAGPVGSNRKAAKNSPVC